LHQPDRILGFARNKSNTRQIELESRRIPERIAVFDNDGTLWSEQPMPVQFYFVADRVKVYWSSDFCAQLDFTQTVSCSAIRLPSDSQWRNYVAGDECGEKPASEGMADLRAVCHAARDILGPVRHRVHPELGVRQSECTGQAQGGERPAPTRTGSAS
jgi:hypothetical protein